MVELDGPEALEAQLVLEGIQARYGYDFRGYAPATMRRRLDAARAKLGASHFGELLHRVLHDAESFAATLDVLTVRVTEMFRDPLFYRAVRELVLPVLRTYPQLKIWHAGCASGEEVYAMAILLSEAGLYERTQIYATDMSAAAVQEAREGVYSEQLYADFERNYREAGGEAKLESYFARGYGSVSVLPKLKRNVHVFQHDLVSDYSPGEMHVIFCRNVLIYFNQPLRRRAYELFEAALVRGGFLCLGASEALAHEMQASYQAVSASGRIYRRLGRP